MSTNIENGVTNVSQQNVLGSLKELDPSLNHTYFNDFEGLLDYTCAFEVTNKDLFSHYSGISFVGEDFFCNL
mgnify:CR=1 FL=1